MAPAPYSVGAGTPVSGRAGLSRGPFPTRSIGPERFRGPVAPSAEAGRFGTGRPRSPARDQRVRAVMALRHGRWQRRRAGGRRWPPPRCARRRGRAWSPRVPMNGSATAGRSMSPPIHAAGGPDRGTPLPRLAPASSRSSSSLPAGAQATRSSATSAHRAPGGHGNTRNRQPSERSRTAKTEETGVERQGGGQRCSELGRGCPTRAKPDSRGIRHEVDERPIWQRELGKKFTKWQRREGPRQ